MTFLYVVFLILKLLESDFSFCQKIHMISSLLIKPFNNRQANLQQQIEDQIICSASFLKVDNYFFKSQTEKHVCIYVNMVHYSTARLCDLVTEPIPWCQSCNLGDRAVTWVRELLPGWQRGYQGDRAVTWVTEQLPG